MTEIYERAHKVYVWLGPASNAEQVRRGVELAARCAKHFVTNFHRTVPLRPWWWPAKQLRQGTVDAAFMSTLREDDSSFFGGPGTSVYEAWLGLKSMLESPWWNRTWILQEATVVDKTLILRYPGMAFPLGKDRVIVACGKYTTSFTNLSHAQTAAYHYSSTTLFDFKPFVTAFSVMQRVYLVRSHRMRLPGTVQPSLLEWLQIFKGAKCTETLDTVFAPLCLTGSNTRSLFKPDYTVKQSDLFLQIARHHINHGDRPLDILGYTLKLPVSLSGNADADLPSWVPDWSDGRSFWPLPKILHVQFAHERRNFRPIEWQNLTGSTERYIDVYHASEGLPELNIHLNGMELCVKGVRVDVIEEVVGFQPDLTQVNARAVAWRSKVTVNGKYVPTGEVYQVTLNHLSCADVKYSASALPVERHGLIENAFLSRRKNELSQIEHEEQLGMRAALHRATKLRANSLTVGGYIGLVPASSKSGDIICAFFGGQVLYALREASTGYIYIGECYIHGLMDGEVAARAPHEVETFVLI